MPSDAQTDIPVGALPNKITGRCYCGVYRLASPEPSRTVTYCHCSDCKRATGAPVAAFAAFALPDLTVSPELGDPVSITPGVKRWFCHQCGSPLAATYDYLPGMIYVPVGLLDQASEFPPQLHSHADQCLRWLKIDDSLDRQAGSARDSLNIRFASVE